jgi:hypothetical protein
MKETKRLTVIIIAVAVVVVLASITSVVAYMFKRSESPDNKFVPAEVECAVREVFEDDTKTSVKVQNNGNIEAYIRVRVVAYWQDSKGNAVAISSPEIKFGGDWKYDADKWIYDSEEKTFYHKAPVAAKELTSELFAEGFAGIKLEKMTKTFDGENYTYHPVVAFLTEGIQSEPDDAVEQWGVTLDGSGNINGLN